MALSIINLTQNSLTQIFDENRTPSNKDHKSGTTAPLPPEESVFLSHYEADSCLEEDQDCDAESDYNYKKQAGKKEDPYPHVVAAVSFTAVVSSFLGIGCVAEPLAIIDASTTPQDHGVPDSNQNPIPRDAGPFDNDQSLNPDGQVTDSDVQSLDALPQDLSPDSNQGPILRDAESSGNDQSLNPDGQILDASPQDLNPDIGVVDFDPPPPPLTNWEEVIRITGKEEGHRLGEIKKVDIHDSNGDGFPEALALGLTAADSRQAYLFVGTEEEPLRGELDIANATHFRGARQSGTGNSVLLDDINGDGLADLRIVVSGVDPRVENGWASGLMFYARGRADWEDSYDLEALINRELANPNGLPEDLPPEPENPDNPEPENPNPQTVTSSNMGILFGRGLRNEDNEGIAEYIKKIPDFDGQGERLAIGVFNRNRSLVVVRDREFIGSHYLDDWQAEASSFRTRGLEVLSSYAFRYNPENPEQSGLFIGNIYPTRDFLALQEERDEQEWTGQIRYVPRNLLQGAISYTNDRPVPLDDPLNQNTIIYTQRSPRYTGVDLTSSYSPDGNLAFLDRKKLYIIQTRQFDQLDLGSIFVLDPVTINAHHIAVFQVFPEEGDGDIVFEDNLSFDQDGSLVACFISACYTLHPDVIEREQNNPHPQNPPSLQQSASSTLNLEEEPHAVFMKIKGRNLITGLTNAANTKGRIYVHRQVPAQNQD